MPDDLSDQSAIDGISAQIESDQKYLEGLWSEISRTQLIIQRALSALEESRELLGLVLPQQPP